MYYILKGHDKGYTVESMIQTFYPNESHTKLQSLNDINNLEGYVLQSILDNEKVYALLYKNDKLIYKNVRHLTCKSIVNVRREIKFTIYNVLKKETGLQSPWGLLTGIRPAKIVRELKDLGLSYKEIKEHFENFYCVDAKKADLAIKVAKKEFNIIKNNDGKDMSIYIGIPFCPTRCLYCSFTSYPLDKYKNRTTEYLNALTKEIEFTKGYTKDRRIENIYIGGGTPTSLSAYELESLLYNIHEKFNMDYINEFTVEAGRPDTINLEKLNILKKYNVSRISINPQTMNNKTLALIGRNHTVEDFKYSYKLARDAGFNNINVDIILGLLGENLEDVKHTMEEITNLNPENITVHTLSIKRASRLKEELSKHNFIDIKVMNEMLNTVKNFTEAINMTPYYLYRQKNMIGNCENVGYSKKGFEGIYNIQIMEERQDILALGAGASSKFVNLKTNKLNRIFNVKSVDDYIARIDDMIKRKVNMEDTIC